MAFSGLMIVGVSAGIFLIGKAVMDDPSQARLVEEEGSPVLQEGELNLYEINQKMNYIQDIIKQYYLFEEDAEAVEDGIYLGLMYGLKDPYSVYYNEELNLRFHAGGYLRRVLRHRGYGVPKPVYRHRHRDQGV